jgi:hypothetical protein
MRFVYPAVLPALALLATITSALAATDDDLKTKIVGAWAPSADCSQGSLVFNANGTFASKPPTGAGDELDGTYSIVNGVLAGVAGSVTMPAVTVSFDAMGGLILTDSTDPTNPDMLMHCK